MNMMSSARHLQELLVIHDRVAEHIQILDFHIDDVSRRLLVHDLSDLTLDLSTQYFRLSIAQGVRGMLERFRLRIVYRVQKLSREILAYLRADDNYEQEVQIEEQQAVTMDTAAWKYTVSVEATLRSD